VTAPEQLAAEVAARPRTLLLSLDVDGTLSPIVDHSADATLVPGALDAVTAFAATPDVVVVAVSGRPVHELRDQFGFPPDVRLVGSHGLEDTAHAKAPLEPEERERLGEAHRAAERAARGLARAWVEDKPMSVALHVRLAAAAEGEAALALFCRAAADLGLESAVGKKVLEVSTRPLSKAAAVARLRDETSATTVVHVGDDASDEAVFAALGPGDVAVKVGDGPSVASARLGGPDEVVTFLRATARRLRRP
jgi:trehalose 6-phosphate phosphatase